ncbi:ATP-dependent DNA helicase [Liquorilactobacillus ghanensis DSM 18630]|uniref:ATP-dependent DNA helicase RecG n=1 Tax=Liquorilactobacillus ghanensis DSM 18630 TaxID=1423750 RepID=A0A0R1VX76_9LACO|nr:ATP-dependent DNA helicase [Liquorilactobacillus ghanensis DSM 18630]
MSSLETILEQSLASLKGVGPKTLQALQHLGITTIEDLLTAFPFRYDDYRPKKIAELIDQEKVTLRGVVATAPVLVHFGRKKNRLNFNLQIDDQVVLVTFFNQGYLVDKVTQGAELTVFGKWESARQQLLGMKLLSLNKKERLAGVYRSSKEIHATQLQRLVKQAFERYHLQISDLLPQNLQKKYHLLSRQQMIHDMHFPADQAAAQAAKRTAVYEEFFLFEARLQYLKQLDQQQSGLQINYDNQQLKKFISQLPFELTAAQKRSVNEICHDMHRPIHMNRLLQGDVGSGKTIVAAIAIYAAVTAGYQAALMAPTEILARQHADKLFRLFEPLGVNVSLLTGATTSGSRQRRELLQQLQKGAINVLVGTHALIQNGVEFKNLGLVITDEQHRFGVNQRQALRLKGVQPDVLALTATPIPRTLALTVYGEMDVSIINELPQGRKPVKTFWLKKTQLQQAFNFIKEQLKQGQQAYLVTPLVSESEVLDLQNAEQLSEDATKFFAPEYQVGLIHGKMKSDEKEQIMTAFTGGKIAVLVATTVIEVGVDVPKASVILILDADRFGLAQLHQLRGRVGRSSKQSYCLLVADPKTDYGRERLQTMTETTDGFVIAQRDLELRGQGDVLGNKQAGLPEFKVADPVKDLRILQTAQIDASQIVKQPDFGKTAATKPLLHYLQRQPLGFD